MAEYAAVDFTYLHTAMDMNRCIVRSFELRGTDSWAVCISKLAFPKGLPESETFVYGPNGIVTEETSTDEGEPYETLFDVIYELSKRNYETIFVLTQTKATYLRKFVSKHIEVAADAANMASLFAMCGMKKKKKKETAAKTGWEDTNDYYVSYEEAVGPYHQTCTNLNYQMQQQQQQQQQQLQQQNPNHVVPPFLEKFQFTGPLSSDDDGYNSSLPYASAHYSKPGSSCMTVCSRDFHDTKTNDRRPRNYCLVHAFACRDFDVCNVLNHTMNKVSINHPFCPSCQADLRAKPTERSLVCRNNNCKFNMKIVLRRDNFGSYYRPHTLNKHSMIVN